MSPQGLSDICHGRRPVSPALALRVSRAFGVSPAWLLFGDEDSPERVQLHRLSVRLRKMGIDPQLLAQADAEMEEWQGDNLVAEAQARYGLRLRVPVVGRASASGDANVIWDPVEPPEWAELPAGVRCVEVRGDSMRPLAWPGQKLLVAQLEAEPKDGDLVVAELADGRQVFKRWWASRDRIVLDSLRSDVPEKPIEVPRRQVRRVWRIVGVLF